MAKRKKDEALQEARRRWLREIADGYKRDKDAADAIGWQNTRLSALLNGLKPITDDAVETVVQKLRVSKPVTSNKVLPIRSDIVPPNDYSKDLIIKYLENIEKGMEEIRTFIKTLKK